MEISIFDVTGPVMIGPSSSHTAGAAILGRAARLIAGQPFHSVSFGLHGSFAQTYKGHGTDRALLAGVLGLSEQDERLAQAFGLAQAAGLQYSFYPVQLDGVHENTVKITMDMDDGTQTTVVGSSIGGGQICICEINGFEMEMNLRAPTLMFSHYDRKGVISEVTRLIAEYDLNIATMKLSRKAKGDVACCVVEADGQIPEGLVAAIRGLHDILTAMSITLDEEEEA